MKNLREIAEIEGLEYFETTSQRNGYPSHLKGALKGFETFQQIKEIAEKYGLSIESFEKKDGWHLWFRTGNRMYEPFSNSSSDYGDNYLQFEGKRLSSENWEEEYYENEVKPYLQECKNLDELEIFIKDHKEILYHIGKADDDELIITNFGSYYETIKKESMYFYNDSHHGVIGLIDRNED